MVKNIFHFSLYTLHLKKVLLGTLFLLSIHSFAQDRMEKGEVRHSYMVGYGHANVLDSYLSPYNYTGSNFKFMFESLTPCKVRLGKGDTSDYLYHTQLTTDASIIENRTKNVSGLAGGARWNIGVLRNFYTNGSFSLYAGPMFNAYVGGVYNERNGNNPAQLKLSVTLDAKVMAMYDFKAWNIPVHVDYRVSAPLVGLAHSPEYGESYYELYKLDDSRNGIVCVYPGNMPSLRHLLTFEVPVLTGHKIRFGYSGDFMQSKIHDLKYHSYTQTFMVGMTTTLFRKSR